MSGVLLNYSFYLQMYKIFRCIKCATYFCFLQLYPISILFLQDPVHFPRAAMAPAPSKQLTSIGEDTQNMLLLLKLAPIQNLFYIIQASSLSIVDQKTVVCFVAVCHFMQSSVAMRVKLCLDLILSLTMTDQRTNRQNAGSGIKCTIGHFKLQIGDSGLGIGDWILGNRLAQAKIGWKRLE